MDYSNEKAFRFVGKLFDFPDFLTAHVKMRFICFCMTEKKGQIHIFLGDTNVTSLTANQKMRFL